jgi:tRNA modification GTPase
MSLDLNDTIVALSSAPGPGARAIVRLSGPDAFRCISPLLTDPVPVTCRRLYPSHVRLPEVPPAVPTDLYIFPAPRTYTGQHMAELHTLGSPPLVELLIAELLRHGARAARPGEFTLRAFLAGKIDLTRAEAVLGVIEAGNRDELRQALAQLAGGITRPLQELRSDLLDLLADLEAGLDFAEEDLHFVSQDELLRRLGKALAMLTVLGRQLEQRSLSGRPFRVVLAGRANAGKTSLFNALTGGAALVSPEPGTTRDYLIRRLILDGMPVELIDTAGWHEVGGSIEEQAQALGREQASSADLLLLCVEAGRDPDAEERVQLEQTASAAIAVATKCDLDTPLFGEVGTSATTGAGLSELRALLAARAKSQVQPALAPSLSRCRHHVAACLAHLREAHRLVLFNSGPELTALELRSALDALGEMVGAVYTDDLLDRIFSRFCIGK